MCESVLSADMLARTIGEYDTAGEASTALKHLKVPDGVDFTPVHDLVPLARPSPVPSSQSRTKNKHVKSGTELDYLDPISRKTRDALLAAKMTTLDAIIAAGASSLASRLSIEEKKAEAIIDKAKRVTLLKDALLCGDTRGISTILGTSCSDPGFKNVVHDFKPAAQREKNASNAVYKTICEIEMETGVAARLDELEKRLGRGGFDLLAQLEALKKKAMIFEPMHHAYLPL